MNNKSPINWKKIFSSSLLIALFTVVCISIPAPAPARVYLELDSPNLRRIPLAVAPLQPLCGANTNAEIARKGRRILIDDLEFSTFFEVLQDTTTFLEKPKSCSLAPGTFDYSNWSLIGAELLVKAGYSVSGKTIVAEFRLYDTVEGKMLVGKRYRSRTRNMRLLFHKFTNLIVEKITGLPGEFTAKVAFCGRVKGEPAQELYTCDYDGYELRKITSNRSINVSPAWSHDTNKLVYTSYRNHNPDLYMIDFTRGKEVLLSRRKGINAAADWSTDDQQLTLMQRYKDHSEITIINSSSGKLIRRLTNSPANQASPCWSPDNRRIAFVSDRSGTPHIYVAAITGGPWQRLTTVDAYNADPDWSDYNDKIVFTSRIDGTFQICTIGSDGSQYRQLTYAQSNCEVPCWSPNGRHILFTKKINHVRQLMVMDEKGRNLKQLTYDKIEKKGPSWSANR